MYSTCDIDALLSPGRAQPPGTQASATPPPHPLYIPKNKSQHLTLCLRRETKGLHQQKRKQGCLPKLAPLPSCVNQRRPLSHTTSFPSSKHFPTTPDRRNSCGKGFPGFRLLPLIHSFNSHASCKRNCPVGMTVAKGAKLRDPNFDLSSWRERKSSFQTRVPKKCVPKN